MQGELLLRAKFQVAAVILQFLILDTCLKDYVLVKTIPRNYFLTLCILFSAGCEQESWNERKAYKNLSVVYLQVLDLFLARNSGKSFTDFSCKIKQFTLHF